MANFIRNQDPKEAMGIGYSKVYFFVFQPDNYHGSPESVIGRTEPLSRDEIQDLYFKAGYNITYWLDEDENEDDDFDYDEATDDEIDAHEEELEKNRDYNKLFLNWGNYPVYKYIFKIQILRSQGDSDELMLKNISEHIGLTAEENIGDGLIGQDMTEYMDNIMDSVNETYPNFGKLIAISTDPNLPSYQIFQGVVKSKLVGGSIDDINKVEAALNESLYISESLISFIDSKKK